MPIHVICVGVQHIHGCGLWHDHRCLWLVCSALHVSLAVHVCMFRYKSIWAQRRYMWHASVYLVSPAEFVHSCVMHHIWVGHVTKYACACADFIDTHGSFFLCCHHDCAFGLAWLGTVWPFCSRKLGFGLWVTTQCPRCQIKGDVVGCNPDKRPHTAYT